MSASSAATGLRSGGLAAVSASLPRKCGRMDDCIVVWTVQGKERFRVSTLNRTTEARLCGGAACCAPCSHDQSAVVLQVFVQLLRLRPIQILFVFRFVLVIGRRELALDEQ